jgi:hypothetical protein
VEVIAISWEAHPKIDVTIGVIHMGTVSMEWAQSFAQLYNYLNVTGRRFYLSFSRGAPYDISRNHCVDDCLKHGSEWLLFIDTDIIVCQDLFDRLVSKNLPCVSALYYRRHKPLHPAMWRAVPKGTVRCPTCDSLYQPWAKGKYNPIVDYPRGQIVEVDVAGCGAMLIHRSVLQKVHHPPEDPAFIWTAGREGYVKQHVLDVCEGHGTSEDFYFHEKVRKAGFKVYVDTSVVLPHETTIKVVAPEMMNVDEVKWGGFEFPQL